MRYILGVDGGGTKTVCVLADEAGRELGRGEGGPSNYYAVGYEGAQRAVASAIESALASGGGTAAQVAAACLGMAGDDRSEDTAVLERMVSQILPDAHVRVYNDAVVALVTGTGRRYGVVIIAGTGSIAYGVNAAGQEARAGGWGHLVDDAGSGYDIGRRAIQSALRAHDGRGPKTVLTDLLVRHLGLTSLDDLAAHVHLGGLGDLEQMAALVPVVEEALLAGDEQAREILDAAARELGLAARAVITRLSMQGEAFDLVLAGGVFRMQFDFEGALAAAVRPPAPQARVLRLTREPVWGAVALAKESL